MREPHITGARPPRDWSEAFSALPPETPPADAMSRALERLPALTPRRSRRLPLALAASLLALACVPLVLREWPHATRNPFAPTQAVAQVDAPVTRAVASPRPVADSTIADTRTARGVEAMPSTAETVAPPAVKHAVAVRLPHRAKPHRGRPSTPSGEPADNAIEPLYAESARLEALLALARDDRAGSATVVALGSDFEARVSAIDTALMQPALSAQDRMNLWRDRVSALRAYASFESTQRALAASGERYDAMLVSID